MKRIVFYLVVMFAIGAPILLGGDIPQHKADMGHAEKEVEILKQSVADHQKVIGILSAVVVGLFWLFVKALRDSKEAERERRKFAEDQVRLALARVQGGK